MASNGSAVTESDAFLAALQQLPLGSNTVVWGKSDELLQKIQQVWAWCLCHPQVADLQVFACVVDSVHTDAAVQACDVPKEYAQPG